MLLELRERLHPGLPSLMSISMTTRKPFRNGKTGPNADVACAIAARPQLLHFTRVTSRLGPSNSISAPAFLIWEAEGIHRTPTRQDQARFVDCRTIRCFVRCLCSSQVFDFWPRSTWQSAGPFFGARGDCGYFGLSLSGVRECLAGEEGAMRAGIRRRPLPKSSYVDGSTSTHPSR